MTKLSVKSAHRDFIGIVAAAIFAYSFALAFDLFDWFATWSRAHEELEVDEIIPLLVILAFAFGAFSLRRWRELKLSLSQYERAEKKLVEQAIRDSLTSLYNRRYFHHRVKGEFAQADRTGQTLAIFLCDLDHFKAVNDTQGHQKGDEILKSVAKSIQASTRGTDLTFRWGGDEFLILLSASSREGILTAAHRIRRGVHNLRNRAQLDFDISIGIALYPEHGTQAEELIRLADRALYIAKKGGDKIHIGEEHYQINEHTVKTVFQPIMDIKSGQVLGYEALSRDPEGKLSVLELFKKFNAIGQLSELKRHCFASQIREAQEAGLKRVFLNVDFSMLSQVQPVPKPAWMEVILEISESEVLNDVEEHLRVAGKWRAQGYQFAIDDFGVGFISLPFITLLTPDYIKMDRSTVLQAVSSDKFRVFLRDLVMALQNYSSGGIIAEGIETEKELQTTKDLGTSLAQGFFLGRPAELELQSPPLSPDHPPAGEPTH